MLRTAAALTQVEGVNFVPIGIAERTFPVHAMTDALNAYCGRGYGIKPEISHNALSKVFR